MCRKVDILSDKVISANNEKETLRRISDRKQEKIIQLQQRIHELEQTQSSSNSKKSTHSHTYSSHNRNQLFSYTLDVDYHKVGISNDMQQTLYEPNNY
jgi:predicted nuclease with TOPRIM domain